MFSQSRALVLVEGLTDVTGNSILQRRGSVRGSSLSVEENSLAQLISEPTRGDAPLDLLFTRREGQLVGDGVVRRNCGHSDLEMIGEVTKWVNKPSGFGLPEGGFWPVHLARILMQRVPWKRILNNEGVKE